MAIFLYVLFATGIVILIAGAIMVIRCLKGVAHYMASKMHFFTENMLY
jgi:uncharacterized membrane protein